MATLMAAEPGLPVRVGRGWGKEAQRDGRDAAAPA